MAEMTQSDSRTVSLSGRNAYELVTEFVENYDPEYKFYIERLANLLMDYAASRTASPRPEVVQDAIVSLDKRHRELENLSRTYDHRRQDERIEDLGRWLWNNDIIPLVLDYIRALEARPGVTLNVEAVTNAVHESESEWGYDGLTKRLNAALDAQRLALTAPIVAERKHNGDGDV